MKNQFLKSVRSQLLKVLMIAVACSLLVFSGLSPALALDRATSSPSEGAAVLDNIKNESKDAVQDGVDRSQKIQNKAQSGPNEVQGSADLHKMYTPRNSDDNTGATSVRKQIENVFEDASPGE